MLVLVDTSPSAMITPTTYFHHLQHAEEFRQNPAVGTFYAGCAFRCYILVIFITILVSVCIRSNSLPANLAFIGPTKMTHLPILLQVLMAEVGLEF